MRWAAVERSGVIVEGLGSALEPEAANGLPESAAVELVPASTGRICNPPARKPRSGAKVS